jgi:hypothetical protein
VAEDVARVVEDHGVVELLADIETDPDLYLNGCGHAASPPAFSTD